MAEFTNGELKLLFQRIDEKLDDIKANMNSQNARYDNEIKDLKEDVDGLKTAITKILAIWGTAWSAITLVAGFVLQRIFS